MTHSFTPNPKKFGTLNCIKVIETNLNYWQEFKKKKYEFFIVSLRKTIPIINIIRFFKHVETKKNISDN